MSFSELLGDTLKGKNANVSTSSALEGKDVVGLYFSAHWCPPCRAFTPSLGSEYDKLKAAGKKIELVFVSRDRDENAFNDYHETMPFLALPFADRSRSDKLMKEFDVAGIPTLVLLDGSGKFITKKGRNAFSSGNTVAEFPFDSYRPLFTKSSSVLEQLGATLKGKDGTLDTKTALAGIDVVGMYFSAHWCPPCRGFTPTLGQKYTALKDAGKSFELVFVSSDRDESSFNDYHNSMPFLALPFAERARKEQLSELYGVQGIPSLIILDNKTGEIINKSARGAISSDNFIEQFPFHPKPCNDLSEELEGINDNSALIVFMEKAPQATKDSLSAALMNIATAEKKKPAEERRVQIFFTGCGGGPCPQIRGGTKLGDATDTPQMVILDLASRGAVYKPSSTTVSEASIQSFMDEFKAGSLTRIQWG